MQKQTNSPTLSPAPRKVALSIRWRLIPFLLPFGGVLAIMGWFFWHLASIGAIGGDEGATYMYGVAVVFCLVAVLIILSALRTWFRRVRVLRHGELAPAEILALHSLESVYKSSGAWRYVEWKQLPVDRRELRKHFRSLREKWGSDQPDVSWNGFGSCLFRFTLPDGSVIVTGAPAALEERLAEQDYDVHDVAVYDPADPTSAILLSMAWPRLTISRSGDWQFAPQESLPIGCVVALICLLTGICAFAWFLLS